MLRKLPTVLRGYDLVKIQSLNDMILVVDTGLQISQASENVWKVL